MPSRVVYLNGRFVPENQARISIYDSALTMGDMAFEVTRTCRHEPYRLVEHLERLWHSLNVLRIDPRMSLDELHEATRETLARNLPTAAADVDWNIIHNVSRGPAGAYLEAFAADELRPTVIVSCFPLERKMALLAGAYETGIDLVVPDQRAVPSRWCDATIKTRSRAFYELANLQAQDRVPGASPLLVDPEGRLTEGTSGNVFLVRGGQLLTPMPRDLLRGVTRGAILDIAGRLGIPSQELDLTVADAAAADELLISSTSIGILHARSLDGRPVGDGRLGPVTARLRETLFADLGLDLAEQARRYAARRRAAGGS